MVMIYHNPPNIISFSRTVISGNGEYIMLTKAEKHSENFSLQRGEEAFLIIPFTDQVIVNTELHLLSSAVTQSFTVHGLLPNAK